MRFLPMSLRPAWLPAVLLLLAAATASAQQTAAQKPARENLTIDLIQTMQPWKGDLDAMIERRVIRVLTVYSKTFYFTDKGDIAASNLTITPDRQKLVDFSRPVHANVSEVMISGPGQPALKGVEDLSGKEVFVRKSSSYYQSLLALNQRLAAQKNPA